MRILLVGVCIIFFQQSFSQRVIDVTKETTGLNQNMFYTVAGEPFVTAKFVNLVEGSPYFNDDWMSAILVDANDRQYKSNRVKLDLLNNEIHYLDDKGTELTPVVSIKQIVLTDSNGNNYKFVHSSVLPVKSKSTKEGWYLWLASGKASLYKFFSKHLSEIKPYNSATVEQHIQTKENYLVLYNNSFIEIKKLKDAPAVLANKKAELENFLKTKDKQTDSMDDRFTALIEFYNSLLKDEK